MTESKPTKSRKRSHRYRKWIADNPEWVLSTVGILSLLLGCVPLTLAWASHHYEGRSYQVMTPSEVGTMFGFVAAVVSGLAFAALIIAVAMQSQELSLQRRELRLTRQMTKRSARAQEDSAQLSLVSAYLTLASTVIQHHDAQPETEKPPNERFLDEIHGVESHRQKAAGFVKDLEGLMHILAPQVKRAVPHSSLQETLDDLHNQMDPLAKELEAGKSPRRFSLNGVINTIHRYRQHLSWIGRSTGRDYIEIIVGDMMDHARRADGAIARHEDLWMQLVAVEDRGEHDQEVQSLRRQYDAEVERAKNSLKHLLLSYTTFCGFNHGQLLPTRDD